MRRFFTTFVTSAAADKTVEYALLAGAFLSVLYVTIAMCGDTSGSGRRTGSRLMLTATAAVAGNPR